MALERARALGMTMALATTLAPCLLLLLPLLASSLTCTCNDPIRCPQVEWL